RGFDGARLDLVGRQRDRDTCLGLGELALEAVELVLEGALALLAVAELLLGSLPAKGVGFLAPLVFLAGFALGAIPRVDVDVGLVRACDELLEGRLDGWQRRRDREQRRWPLLALGRRHAGDGPARRRHARHRR